MKKLTIQLDMDLLELVAKDSGQSIVEFMSENIEIIINGEKEFDTDDLSHPTKGIVMVYAFENNQPKLQPIRVTRNEKTSNKAS